MRDRPGHADEPARDDREHGDQTSSASDRRWDPYLGDGRRLSDYDLPDDVRSVWDDPAVRDQPERPAPEKIRLDGERRDHIVDRHASGAGWERKTEFPADWDNDRICATILDVAQRPRQPPVLQDHGRWLLHGVRDKVEVSAVVNPDGRIWTAWPEPGGPGVVRNPERGDGT